MIPCDYSPRMSDWQVAAWAFRSTLPLLTLIIGIICGLVLARASTTKAEGR